MMTADYGSIRCDSFRKLSTSLMLYRATRGHPSLYTTSVTFSRGGWNSCELLHTSIMASDKASVVVWMPTTDMPNWSTA